MGDTEHQSQLKPMNAASIFACDVLISEDLYPGNTNMHLIMSLNDTWISATHMDVARIEATSCQS